MTKKKERAFFVCPRWSEVAADSQTETDPALSGRTPRSAKTILAISKGQPVVRSTLRKALLAVRQDSGVMFDVDAYIVDQRVTQPR